MPAPQDIYFSGFPGGVNQRDPADEIQDTELVDALNVELDQVSNVRVRRGTTKLNTGTALTGRITSVYHFIQSDNTNGVLVTSGTKLYRYNSGAGTLVDQTGTATLPSDTYWQWVTFGDYAIGANGATSGTNPVKVTTPTTNAALLANAPFAKHIEVMNSRLFIVPVTEPNTVRFSEVGLPEGWTTGSSAADAGAIIIGAKEGSPITGIRAYRDQLIVFMRDRIYAISFGSPNTDKRQWEVHLVTRNTGCVSIYSVQEILGDLIFLSDEGVMSLQALLSASSNEEANLSKNITDLRNVNKSVDTFASVVVPDKSQYWLSVSTTGSPSVNDTVWVLDYSSRRGAGGRVAWLPWDGGPAGASLARVIESGQQRIYIGGYNDLLRHGDDSVWSDNGSFYSSFIQTKAYNFTEPLIRHEFFRLGAQFEALTDPASFTIFWRLDQDDSKSGTISGTFSGLSTGALFDSGYKFDNSDTFATEVSQNTDIDRKLLGSAGRRGQSIQLKVANVNVDEAFTLKAIKLVVGRLTRKFVSDV